MKNKFTAVAVTNQDKSLVQELRKEYSLTEKEMLSAILATVLTQKDTLQEVASKIKESRVKRVRVSKVAQEEVAQEEVAQEEVAQEEVVEVQQ